jgi:hypothetical protein
LLTVVFCGHELSQGWESVASQGLTSLLRESVDPVFYPFLSVQMIRLLQSSHSTISSFQISGTLCASVPSVVKTFQHSETKSRRRLRRELGGLFRGRRL